jgi:hypothetical protein
MLKPVRVLSISTISRTSRRFHIGSIVGFRTQHPKKSTGIKRACPYLNIIGLMYGAPTGCPIALKI